MKSINDDSDISVGPGLHALRKQLETLNLPADGTRTRRDFPSANEISTHNYVLAHGSYEMWLKSEPRIPLKAYWAAFCLLCFVSYVGPQFLHTAWSVGLAWVLNEWHSRNRQRKVYQHGVEFGLSVAANRGARGAENLAFTAGEVRTERASTTERTHEAGDRARDELPVRLR